MNTKRLNDLHACGEAIDWLVEQPNLYHAWRTCTRADWMLWLLARIGCERSTLVLCACDIARTALCHVPKGEDRPLLAIDAAEAWTRGECSLETVRAAADAADAADARIARVTGYCGWRDQVRRAARRTVRPAEDSEAEDPSVYVAGPPR